MKKLYTLLALLLVSVSFSYATMHFVNLSGFSYSPGTTNAVVGDSVTIQANGTHPCMQVSQTDWNSGTATALSGGFGNQGDTFTFKITTAADIYFLCSVHKFKGKIAVTTGIYNPLADAKGVNIYPNPANIGDEFTISLSGVTGKKQISFYSMTGQMIQSVQASDFDKKISVVLAAGTYYCVIVPENSNDIYRRKVVVLQ